MARTPLIAGNWKMNTTVAEARELTRAMLAGLDQIQRVEKLLCPPFISLTAVAELLKGSSVKLGAQNMHHEGKGAFTGEVSPGMLKDCCKYVILGHSERRSYFHEQDADINRKVLAALNHGLAPVFCIGEDLTQRQAGQVEAVLTGQLATGLQDTAFSTSLVIAYEPVWSIGTGTAAQPEDVEEVGMLIRGWLEGALSLVSPWRRPVFCTVAQFPPATWAALCRLSTIDGALVGGASLRPDEFVALVKAAADAG